MLAWKYEQLHFENISSELLKRFDQTTSIIFDSYLHQYFNTIWPTVIVGPLTTNITILLHYYTHNVNIII